jgi:ferrous iron transport protein A
VRLTDLPLREFGLCEGASVEALHRGGIFGRGPIACKVGRMTIAMRRSHAAAVTVRTGPDSLDQDMAA